MTAKAVCMFYGLPATSDGNIVIPAKSGDFQRTMYKTTTAKAMKVSAESFHVQTFWERVMSMSLCT